MEGKIKNIINAGLGTLICIAILYFIFALFGGSILAVEWNGDLKGLYFVLCFTMACFNVVAFDVIK